MKKFVNFTTNFLKLYSPEEKYLYKIEEIDETLNQVTISCRGKNISLVSSINEIGYDQTIVTLLPPHHACWIGYYFGQNWCIHKTPQKNNPMELQHSNHQDSNYRIICQDRIGDIFYQNSLNGLVCKMDPIELAKSKTIILFNSSQAFYIGFLASLKNNKNMKKKVLENKPILKLVK